ncbi:FCD domain-containing protein [Peribacillus frigoritolerans]|uniref:FCD domain-containing protein n=1 Tax=Peribacillus frigoritolerans TaxID=450367 RepID=UPI00330570CC
MTEEELKKLEWATDKLQLAINSNDRIAASRANIEFHRLLYSYWRIPFSKKLPIHYGFLFEFPFYRPVMRMLLWLIYLGMRNDTTITYKAMVEVPFPPIALYAFYGFTFSKLIS